VAAGTLVALERYELLGWVSRAPGSSGASVSSAGESS
jgi:hypothetical protein